jgi:hypothetical protein
MPESELLEERRSRSVMERPSQTFAPADDVNQPTLAQRLEDRACPHSSYLLNLRSPDRLSVRDYRERLERRCGKALWACRQLSALDRFGVFGARKDLPATRNFDQLDAMTVGVVVVSQLIERRVERGLAIVGVSSHEAQRVDRNRNGAREERRFKQLR